MVSTGTVTLVHKPEIYLGRIQRFCNYLVFVSAGIKFILSGPVKRINCSKMPRRADKNFSIHVTNLSESTTQKDLKDLFKPFGMITKLYLAQDKHTKVCKGFAYIHFKFRNDAVNAIVCLNGHVYNNLIIEVDWSRPLSSSNKNI